MDESAHYHSIFGLWEEAERICGLTGRTDTRCTIRVLLVVSAKQVFVFFCRLLYMFCVHNLFLLKHLPKDARLSNKYSVSLMQ